MSSTPIRIIRNCRFFPDLIFHLRVIFEKEDVEYVADANIPEWLAEKLKQSRVL
jgi:hypothetical protein